MGTNAFEELCRLCASYDAIKMDIFGEKGRERKLLEKIHACLPFQVSERDLLPKSLCYRCIYNLENFYDFRKGCVDAVSRLENYVNEGFGNSNRKKVATQGNVRARTEEKEDDSNSVISIHSYYEDSEEPNPADFLEACMVGEPAQPTREENAPQVIEINEGSFVCPTCPKSFTNMPALILHSKLHMVGGSVTIEKKEQQKLYACPLCNKTFLSKGNLSNHVKVHSVDGSSARQGSRPFQCELCNKSYALAKHLWGHVSSTHRGHPRVTCNFCSRIFSTAFNLQEHKKTRHPVETEEESKQVENNSVESEDCVEIENESQCSIETPKMTNEEVGGSRRKNSKPRKIERDQNIEDDNYDYYSQMSTEGRWEDDEQPSSCFICNRVFTNQNALKAHFMSVHDIDQGDLDFGETNKSGTRKDNVDENDVAENMLEAETVFCCEVCIREFNDRASLWLHMLYSHKEEAATACGICLRVCSDNVSLLEHVDSCHPRDSLASDQRRYSCQICARQHDSRKKLLAHVKIHNLRDVEGHSVDPESMVILNSDYYGQDLQPPPHMMDEELPLSCEICYKSFPTEIKLIKHKRNSHKDSESLHSLNSSATYHLYFSCELCGLSHSTRTERWRHVFSCHSDEPSLVCDLPDCGKVFPTRAMRIEHTSSHHDLQGAMPNTCEICGKLWATRVNYWKHMMGVHSDSLPFICGVCLKIFCNVGDLAAHVRGKHWPLEGGDFCCDICGRPYSKKSKMSRHRKIHDLPVSQGGLAEGQFDIKSSATDMSSDMSTALKCEECPNEEFLDLEELSEHRRSAHNLVPCDLCPKYYGRTSHLWKHVNKIHKSHPDITCNLCLRTSASRAHLAKHITKHHRSESIDNLSWHDEVINAVGGNNDSVHTCTKCSKVFRKDHLMRQHFKHCTGPRTPSSTNVSNAPLNGAYQCEKCLKMFETPGVLRKHIRVSHIVYPCELCEDVGCDSKTELMDHIREAHNGHPDLTCDVPNCLKMLRCKKDLNKHKKEHRQGYPPPTCEFCGELLTNRLKLRMHLKTFHTQKSKHMCSVCMSSLSSFEELRVHIQTNHPSVVGKPNVCPVCGKKCPTKYKLYYHVKIHGNDFWPCEVCVQVFNSAEALKEHSKKHPPKKNKQSNSKGDVTNEMDETNELESEENDDIKADMSEGEPPLKKFKSAPMCGICSQKFDSKVELDNHERDKHADFICTKCNKLQVSMESHVVVCQSEADMQSPLVTLPRSSVLENSLRSIVKSEPEDDGDSGEDAFELDSHSVDQTMSSIDDNSSSSKEVKTVCKRRVYENNEVLSICEVCGKEWSAKKQLWQHLIRSHQVEAARTCGVCLKLCKDYERLDYHLAKAHPNNFKGEGNTNICCVCGRYHNTHIKLENHATLHFGHEKRALGPLYRCKHCDMIYNSQRNLDEHELDKHSASLEDDSQDDIFLCDICNKTWESKNLLVQHMNSHKEEEATRVETPSPRDHVVENIIKVESSQKFISCSESVCSTDTVVPDIRHNKEDINDVQNSADKLQDVCLIQNTYNVGDKAEDNVDDKAVDNVEDKAVDGTDTIEHNEEKVCIKNGINGNDSALDLTDNKNESMKKDENSSVEGCKKGFLNHELDASDAKSDINSANEEMTQLTENVNNLPNNISGNDFISQDNVQESSGNDDFDNFVSQNISDQEMEKLVEVFKNQATGLNVNDF